MAIIAILLFTFFCQRTPLHLAASNGHDYTVECLVEKGADMNIRDKTGVSELYSLHDCLVVATCDLKLRLLAY